MLRRFHRLVPALARSFGSAGSFRSSDPKAKICFKRVLLGGSSLIAGAGILCVAWRSSRGINCEEEEEEIVPGEFKDGLPVYTRAQVAAHRTKETGVWVTYKSGVYDITDFVVNHPGGAAKISMASGGSIEPFWAIYGAHKNQDVYAILEGLRIGNVSKEEPPSNEIPNDPFKDDPSRHPALVPRNIRPYNAEAPLEIIAVTLLF